MHWPKWCIIMSTNTSPHKSTCVSSRCHAFQGLPFVLNTAPRVFTKLISCHSSWLAEKRYSIIIYPYNFRSLIFLHLPIDSQTTLLSLRESDPKHTEQISKSHLQSELFIHYSNSNEMISHSFSLRSGKPIGSLEAALPAIWQAPYTSKNYQYSP